MVKCPFCGFGNEDGSLFCEQCKSDISGAEPAPAEAPIMAAVVEEPVVAEVVPAAVVEEAVVAEVITAAPVEEVVQAVEVVEAPPEPAPVAEAAPPPPPPPPPPPVAAEPAAAPAAAPAPAAKAGAAPAPIPQGAQPKLVVQRGLKINEEYNIFAGDNYIGRADEKPVDIDLTFQEPEDRVWVSRQHALVVFDDTTGMLTIEDLNSANGTFVNRERVYPGQPKQISVGNTLQIGTVHMRIKV